MYTKLIAMITINTLNRFFGIPIKNFLRGLQKVFFLAALAAFGLFLS